MNVLFRIRNIHARKASASTSDARARHARVMDSATRSSASASFFVSRLATPCSGPRIAITWDSKVSFEMLITPAP
jgi:hypothetical protein